MFLLPADFPSAEGQEFWNSSWEEGLYHTLKRGPSLGRQDSCLASPGTQVRQHICQDHSATSLGSPALSLTNARTEEPPMQLTPRLTLLCQGLWCEPEAAILLRESMSLAVLPTYLCLLGRFIRFYSQSHTHTETKNSVSFLFKCSACLLIASHCIIYKRHTALFFLNTTCPILNTSLNWILSYVPWLCVEIYCFKVKGEELNYYPEGCLYTSMIHPLILPWGRWELHGLVKNRAKYSSADWQGCPS